MPWLLAGQRFCFFFQTGLSCSKGLRPDDMSILWCSARYTFCWYCFLYITLLYCIFFSYSYCMIWYVNYCLSKKVCSVFFNMYIYICFVFSCIYLFLCMHVHLSCTYPSQCIYVCVMCACICDIHLSLTFISSGSDMFCIPEHFFCNSYWILRASISYCNLP